MKIADIVDFEASNNSVVLLVREGLFWRAYGPSAQLFCRRSRVGRAPEVPDLRGRNAFAASGGVKPLCSALA